MSTPIKPRYRLGTQNMLDLAKDDARLIPENTLFMVTHENYACRLLAEGTIVKRSTNPHDYYGPGSLLFENARDGTNWAHLDASDLKPFL